MTVIAVCERTPKVVVAGDLRELVRGREQELLNRLVPIVKREDIALDLSGVERIDAAGLSALIRLYCDACKAGKDFKVMHPGRHVREILGLVGLDRFLFNSDVNTLDAQFHETAA